ncbi:neurofilament light polypeptide [Salarias fasciatus]|uniref:Neurofilament light polypeptide-like n=1 Tax=Salarias fasciatus TaxID=181472 RepID=A0A672JBE8_SALFA|nr:neurofilament light polypeptide-like [Salarias fasciatus]
MVDVHSIVSRLHLGATFPHRIKPTWNLLPPFARRVAAQSRRIHAAMAMLRVSSYRKLFEEDGCSENGGLGAPCAGQYRASARRAAPDQCDCDKLDFAAAKTLSREGLSRFVKDRGLIAALNDRLVRLIKLAHCFEEENKSLEFQILDLQEKLDSQMTPSRTSSAVVVPDRSLDAAVERLRRQRDEILCDTEELRKELECLQEEYEKAAQLRVLIQQERQDVSQEVDAVTAECLALREQVAIYEQQLANMEAQHSTEVGTLLQPDHGMVSAAALKFGSPDISPILDVKEYYCQLAQSLQFECGASSSAVALHADGKELEVGGTARSTVKDLSKIKDVGEMKDLISRLQKELAELERCGEELEDEVEMKRAAYVEQIAELKCTIDEMRHKEADLKAQMSDQCDDYQELLSEKMARDMEIAAYRSLMEEEEARLCCL